MTFPLDTLDTHPTKILLPDVSCASRRTVSDFDSKYPVSSRHAIQTSKPAGVGHYGG